MSLQLIAEVAFTLLFATCCLNATAAEATVEIHPETEIASRSLGLGIQFDPFDYQPTPEQWKTITNRVARCHPGYIRLCIMAESYCAGFDASGKPIFGWQKGASEDLRKSLARTYAILDFAQAHDIDVLLGEWGPPYLPVGSKKERLGVTDPRWAGIIADFVAHLRSDRHYSVVRYFNFINEPNGDWSGCKSYEDWIVGMRNLHKEFLKRNLTRAVRIIGPDTTGNTDWQDPFTWLERSARDIPEVIQAYDLHWYAQDKEVLEGKLEPFLREKRKLVLAVDPGAKNKPLFLGESGIITGRTNGDQQPRVRTFEYGVLMADYVAQVKRAGWMGALAWDLDDAMHLNEGPATPIPGPRTLKIWGFWNSQGGAMGHPEEEQPRPWFTTWLLMSNLFDRDARIVEARGPRLPGFRALAATDKTGRQLSLMLVNDSDENRTVTVCMASEGKSTLNRYDYFAETASLDKEGLPKPAKSIVVSDWNQGIQVRFPARGAVFLTTRRLFQKP